MKKTYLLLLLSVFLFSACSDDKDDVTDKIKLTATFHYLSGNEKKPDAATLLYVFKIDKGEQGNYEFKTEQKYLQHKTDKTVVYPYITSKANNDGTTTMDIDDKTFYQTIFVSAIQPETWGIDYLDAKGSNLTLNKEYALKQ